MLAGRGRAVLNEIAAQDVSCDEASWRRWILRLRAGWPCGRAAFGRSPRLAGVDPATARRMTASTCGASTGIATSTADGAIRPSHPAAFRQHADAGASPQRLNAW